MKSILRKILQVKHTKASHYPKTANHPQSSRKLIVLTDKRCYKHCLRQFKQLGVKPVKTIRSMNAILCHTQRSANLQKLQNHAMVKRVEGDQKVKLHGIANASCASNRGPQITPRGISRIQAPQIRSRSSGGRNIRLAVIDSGVGPHPDLRVAGNVNTINNQSAKDDNGHGTHVAGTAAALCNSFGVVGAAPAVKLFNVKAFNKNGEAFVSDIVQGIDWCIRNNIQVINMSFGLLGLNITLRDIIRRARRKGIIMVASCGNNGSEATAIDFPARFPETIAVAATNFNNQIASFSSRGRGIDISAPGVDICSTFLNRSYIKLSGTSMAVPHVSGTAALLLAVIPGLTPGKFLRSIQLSAKKLKNFPITAQGAGLIQAKRALQVALRAK